MKDDDTAPVVLQPGAEVAGHRIEKLLGTGGFGGVYAALDLALDRPVALKVLKRADARLLARFRDEARLLARVNDPHVIQIYRVGQLPSGEPYLSMERFGDCSLGELVERGQAAPLETAVQVVAQMLRALVAAHRAGIVHRDIKEANVLLDRASGLVKLCDFGIARAQEGEREVNTGDMVVGTPHYVAPERFRGVQNDPRSDLYSVGVVFYRLLTGARPFETPGANAMVIARRAATEDVRPPADVPRAIARVCVQLLARDPELRPATAHMALEALLRAWRAEPTASVAGPDALALAPIGVPLLEAPPAAHPPPGRRMVLAAGLAVVVAAALGLWWLRPEALRAARDAGVPAPISQAAPAPRVDAGPRSDAAAAVAARPDAATPAPPVDASRPAPASAPPRPHGKRVAPSTVAPAAPASEPAWKKARTPLSPHARDNPVVEGGGTAPGIIAQPPSGP